MLINRKACKLYALQVATETRAQGFRRVAGSFLERLDRAMALEIEKQVQIHPSKGKTLR